MSPGPCSPRESGLSNEVIRNFGGQRIPVFGVCLGCIAFGYLMKAGAIPEDVCEACADISLRHPQLSQSRPA